MSMMNPSALANLTKASVTHLIRQGHMTPRHGAKIMKGAGLMPKAPVVSSMPGPTALKARIPGGGPVDDEGVPTGAEAPMGALDAHMSGPARSILTPYDE